MCGPRAVFFKILKQGFLLACRRPGEEDIQFAADLAAWFSKARGEGKAPVTMAGLANIRKVKGGPPGRVIVTKEEVTFGRPDQSAAALEATD